MIQKRYSTDPQDAQKFQTTFDRFYTRSARLYALFIKVLPFWKRWLNHALPHIQGERVLEVSFGTGYLLTQYAGGFNVSGVDYNQRMVEIARQALSRQGLSADLRQGNVESLPYPEQQFDTLVNTMALSGYPDAGSALSEMKRVLKTDGRLILIDINYPRDGNLAGMIATRLWQLGGDLIRDLEPLLEAQGFSFQDTEIGGFGSVHLYLCQPAH